MKIALTFDGDIVAIVGLGQRALGADTINAASAHARADLNAGWRTRLLTAGGGAGTRDLLVKQILKLRPLPLVSGRVHIGDVVRDDIDIGLLREHAGGSDGQGTHGYLLYF